MLPESREGTGTSKPSRDCWQQQLADCIMETTTVGPVDLSELRQNSIKDDSHKHALINANIGSGCPHIVKELCLYFLSYALQGMTRLYDINVSGYIYRQNKRVNGQLLCIVHFGDGLVVANFFSCIEITCKYIRRNSTKNPVSRFHYLRFFSDLRT